MKIFPLIFNYGLFFVFRLITDCGKQDRINEYTLIIFVGFFTYLKNIKLINYLSARFLSIKNNNHLRI